MAERTGLDYRSYVGPEVRYDLVAAAQFVILTYLGLREYHTLLDIGCGSLRGGKLFIPYLLPEKYFGVEPEKWLVEDGIKYELGKDILTVKRPRFLYSDQFQFSEFGMEFDYLLAQSIFTHASQSQIRKCLSEAKKVMHKNSLLIATVMPGDSDYEGDEWVYPEAITYTLKTMYGLVREQGMYLYKLDWPHPGRHIWMLIAKRNDIDPASLPSGDQSLS